MAEYSIEVIAFGPKHLRRTLRLAALLATAGIPRTVREGNLKRGIPYRLEVSLVSDREMRRLNKTYRAKNRPTDVLSFPSPLHDFGDVLIAWGVAKRQAKEYGGTLAEELQRLTVHGVLHLFGYDHERSAKEAKRMFRLQDRLLSRMRSGSGLSHLLWSRGRRSK